MPYEVIYGPAAPATETFDTLEEAIGFAEHRPKSFSAAVWERTDEGASMVWPTTDVAAFVAEHYSTPPRTGPITLADAIARSGISKAQLSRDSGVPAQRIYLVLSGGAKFSNLTIRSAARLAEALDVDPRDLLAGETNRTNERRSS